MRRALLFSAAAHALLALALLGGARLIPGLAPAPPPPAEAETEAEMVFENPGGLPARQQPPPPQPAPPTEKSAIPPESAPQPPPVPKPPPSATEAEPAPAPPPPPPQPAPAKAAAVPPATAQPQEEPEVRLGDEAGTTDEIRSEDLSVGPDPSAPNIPPRYPPDAVRRGEQGVVVLLVNVAPNGAATGVQVYASSGFMRLDRAARDAVAHWRFKAKNEDGLPAPSRTMIRIKFTLD